MTVILLGWPSRDGDVGAVPAHQAGHAPRQEERKGKHISILIYQDKTVA